MREIATRSWRNVCRWGQAAGPYLVLELVMPGGTLLAFLLFLHRRGRP